MLKRFLTATQHWLSPARPAQVPTPQAEDEEARTARRGFFTKAAVGAVSLTGAAGLAKVVVDSAPEPDLQNLYAKEGLAGERELMEREYVLMSDQEKEDMVQGFISDYGNQG